MNIIKLGSTELTRASPPYVIAEIGVNHEGSMETAKKLIELAKEGGANCAKFQTYKANKLASKCAKSSQSPPLLLKIVVKVCHSCFTSSI